MDPVNIIIGINIVATFGANISGAKQGFKSAITKVKEKPKTYLQKISPILATLSLVALILALFQIGTLVYDDARLPLRAIGLLLYVLFSWIQIWAYKSLGSNYSQDVVIFQKHELVTKGIYGVIRHPHYLSQILVDASAALATMSYIVAPLALLQIPFLFLRAKQEETLLQKHFPDTFPAYKKKTGFFLPFIG